MGKYAYLLWAAQKVCRLFIPICAAICLLTGCAPPDVPVSTGPSPATAVENTPSAPFIQKLPAAPELGGLGQTVLEERTDRCTISYPEGEQIGASFIGMIVEDNLERVSTDLGYRPPDKIKVFVYPDLETFHRAIKLPDAPSSVIAVGYQGGVQMVTPRLIPTALLDKTIVHELTHALQGLANPDAPFWMIEGVALFESGMSEGLRETVSQGVQKNTIPSLASLETLDAEGFEQAGGYAYGYTVVEYAVLTYGKETLKEWVKTPRDYDRVFHVSAEIFERDWRKYLAESYSKN